MDLPQMAAQTARGSEGLTTPNMATLEGQLGVNPNKMAPQGVNALECHAALSTGQHGIGVLGLNVAEQDVFPRK